MFLEPHESSENKSGALICIRATSIFRKVFVQRYLMKGGKGHRNPIVLVQSCDEGECAAYFLEFGFELVLSCQEQYN